MQNFMQKTVLPKEAFSIKFPLNTFKAKYNTLNVEIEMDKRSNSRHSFQQFVKYLNLTHYAIQQNS